MSQNTAPSPAPQPRQGSTLMERHYRVFQNLIHAIVLLLSLALIVYISYDTFMNIPFLTNTDYMHFQFWVCVVFLLDFFIEMAFAPDKKKYVRRRWFFFVISIPYLNFINYFDITLPHHVIYYLRFIPLIRGAYSLAMVMGYISENRAVSMLSQYTAILLALVYILGLLFFYEEHEVNSYVRTFWDALYFAAMNTTTVGCYFSAVTPVGKIISVICPTAGMLMLPLFTVYVTTSVHKYDVIKKVIAKDDPDNEPGA